MSPSSFSPANEPAHPDRRGGPRVLNIQPCEYELAHVADQETIEFSDGQALTLNTSPGGFLLLMPQSLNGNRVFEVHTPSQTGDERSVKVVETRWMREVTFGSLGRVYLVGVRSLFEPIPERTSHN